MTPKEKAKELVDKFRNEFTWVEKDHNVDLYRDTKQCALIAVEECIESIKQLIHYYTKGDNEKYVDIYFSMSLSVAYWQEVKKEIQNG